MQQKLKAIDLCHQVNGKQLLKQISLQFGCGKLHGILGPNGSGKSTFLKTLSGIWKPSSGKVMWEGKSLLELPRNEISRIISLVPQHQQIAFDFLVEDLVAMGRYSLMRNYWKVAEEPIVYDALTMVDAWHLRRRKVNQLSGGERQRVYIARALVTESPVMLLDEPTSSLDIKHQIEIWQLLRQMVQNGKIVIVTTHDLRTAEKYCDHIAVLNNGHCQGEGPFEKVMSKELLQAVFGVTESNNQYQLTHS